MFAKRSFLLVPLALLLGCGDPVAVGMELPGGFIVRERSPMPSLEVCAAHARKNAKGDPVAEKIDEHHFIYSSTLNTGRKLIQICQYKKGEIFYIQAISREAVPPGP